MKILIVFGTRPEAIKMCPLVLVLKKHKEIDCKVCLTGQHREMLDQVMKAFEVEADYNLDIMKNRQTLTTITTSVMEGLETVLEQEKPDIVLVHGDTTTSYAAALAAFYQKIPVGHVEAGLRTGDIYSPFPEEMNRLLTDRISTYYFAPTELNRQNLLKEGISNNIFVTGNTVIDAFHYTVKDDYVFSNEILDSINYRSRKVITVTAHRRENLGRPLENICNAIKRLATEYKDSYFVYPVHLNPAVRDTVFTILSEIDNVKLIEPVDVLDMHNLLARSYMVMTDSGGLQEEAPHFGKPVLVLRTETERPEAVEAGTVKVVGVDSETIYKEAKKLIDDTNAYQKMAHAVNPYGDGHASERIVQELLRLEGIEK
ncbi:UDP-N-acetylglucosamine 2-epimerase (non-hydrolyzing) [Ruminococcus sp.]|uniref:non-hydrolyzing UDP-N-acetylglucosamine 2-epimerase n=1 Tax=Ruminococcus sp. TaxID=41978 RepID=UPI0025F8407C|nr:UDP-N-acetylglucosamine 2-epimerase (non-hydrolyzing) [Ruminococcus sp.]